MYRTFLFLILGLLPASHICALDHIETKDGRVLDGEIIRRDQAGTPNESLIIQNGPVQITLRANQIATIAPATPEDATIAQAREAFKTNEAERGVSLLAQALGMSMEPGRQANALGEVMLRHGDELAHILPALNDEQTTALRRVVAIAAGAKNLPPARNAELIARRLQFDMLLGDDADTSRVLAWLGPDYFKQNSTERERLTQWVLGALAPMQAAGQREGAPPTQERMLQVLDLMRGVDPNLAGSQRTQLIIEWASKERQAGRWTEALHLYQTQLLNDVPEIARDRIQLTLDEAERACREKDDLPAAAALYEQYGMPTDAKMARERLLVIWHDQGWRDLRRHDFDAARACFGKAEAIQPGAAKLDYAQLDYQRQKEGTPTTDTLARYQLGMFCMKNDLFPEAVAELKLARANTLIRENADAHIGNIRNKQAEAELLRLMKLSEAGEYGKVLGGVNIFLQEEYAPGYLKQALWLKDLTSQRLKLQVAERPQQAEGLLQRAQRAYFDSRYAEAEELLRAVIERFDGTPAQTRARNFYAAVRQKLELARQEQGSAGETVNTNLATTHSANSTTTLTTAEDELARLRRNLERMNYQQ